MSATEETPLLTKPAGIEHLRRKGLFSTYRRILLATFLLSTTFAFTATPLIYAYRLFNCQEYYDDPAHPPYEGSGDACAVPVIESHTARDIAIMITLTTFSGTLNLIVTTWEIKNWGLRRAIINQTFWPALRNLTQIYATLVGGRLGITVMQSTQLITILGGGAGYLLTVNSYMAEVAEPEERTAAFGVLAGVAMLGVANGYICGGLSNDYIGLSAPFEITFCLLVASTFFTAFCLPYIPPGGFPANKDPNSTTQDRSEEEPKKDASAFGFLRCLRIFLPAKYADGKGTFWGLPLLGFGAFWSVMATAYVPLMLQLTATNQYGFKPGDNGFLMSGNALSRAAFLTLAFPKIITYGRKCLTKPTVAGSPVLSPAEDDVAGLPTDPRSLEPHEVTSGESAIENPVNLQDAMPPTDKSHGSAFDLEFLRYSMIVDAGLVALLVFSSNSAHIWAAAIILPLASGTAPACKGVLLDMVPASQKTDALSAIALVETSAMITTVSLYGALFAFLSSIGHPNLVFLFNALTALLSAFVLFAVRFPRGLLVAR
ncbi:hypothetical protein DFH08DRAFT_1085029 [Mycena albidolilacea]|uniref:Uncharacterized protein n=1 Tax=Mycena albidolilacea TaxID=1033008 RepID=A0AAD7EIZ9_9AGAR|nr:hypothetical protein DFH08DRAFT_1085029 [Mycena albidolilacea]